MSLEGIFAGYALGAIDDKGRVAVPAALRNSIPGDVKGRQLFIAKHPEAQCLIASGSDRLKRLAEELEDERKGAIARNIEFDRYAYERKLFAGEVIPIDASGRFVMPPVLMRRAKLGSDVFLYGAGRYFEIWDLAFLLASEDPRFEEMRETAEALIAERDAKAVRA